MAFALLRSQVLIRCRILSYQHAVVTQEVDGEAQNDRNDDALCHTDNFQLINCHEPAAVSSFFLQSILCLHSFLVSATTRSNCDKRVNRLGHLGSHCEEDAEEHSQESCVVVEPDIITHPHAVVVEFVSAPVASLAVLRVLQDVCVANTAIEAKLGLVEDYLGGAILRNQASPVGVLKNRGWIRRIALCHYGSRNDHQEVDHAVECSKNYPCPQVLSIHGSN